MRWFIAVASIASVSGSIAFAADLRKLKPVVAWTGTDSKQTGDSFARCCSPKDWYATWQAHRGRKGNAEDPTCPEVDFQSYMVIAVFRKTSRISVSDIVEENHCVRVRYQPWGNQIVFAPDPDTK
jgi:hypothetical protein